MLTHTVGNKQDKSLEEDAFDLENESTGCIQYSTSKRSVYVLHIQQSRWCSMWNYYRKPSECLLTFPTKKAMMNHVQESVFKRSVAVEEGSEKNLQLVDSLIAKIRSGRRTFFKKQSPHHFCSDTPDDEFEIEWFCLKN